MLEKNETSVIWKGKLWHKVNQVLKEENTEKKNERFWSVEKSVLGKPNLRLQAKEESKTVTVSLTERNSA